MIFMLSMIVISIDSINITSEKIVATGHELTKKSNDIANPIKFSRRKKPSSNLTSSYLSIFNYHNYNATYFFIFQCACRRTEESRHASHGHCRFHPEAAH